MLMKDRRSRDGLREITHIGQRQKQGKIYALPFGKKHVDDDILNSNSGFFSC